MPVVKIVPMPGPQGDGLNFRGAWVTNTLYKKNDVVTQNGSSYIANYDYQDTSGPSLDGDLWAPLALKGEDGTGSADIADFVFNYDEEETNSTITIHNHDMVIQTTRDGEEDSDISLNSADDIWINANDTVEITSYTDEVRVYTGDLGNRWAFEVGGGLRFPDDTVQTTAYTGGSSADLGDFTFTDNVATVQNAQSMVLNTTNGQESEVKAQLVLDPNNNAAILSANGNLQTEYFSTGDWSSATWTADGNGGSSIHFVTSWNFLEFANTSVNDTSQITVLVNETYPAGFNYYTYDGFENLYVYLNNVTPPEDPTVNNIQFQYLQSSKVAIDYDDGIVIVDGKGLDVRVRSDDDVYIEAAGDDLFLRANDAIRFTANWESGEETYGWRMNSDGKFRLPEEGFISNPRATVATTSTRNLFYTDNYLNDQSGVNDSTAVLLPVDVDSSWFADYGNQQLFDFPAVLTFADSTTVDLVAIYDATSQGTPAIVAQWSGNLTKTFEEAYPLSIYVDYTTVTFDGTPTIAIDPSGYDNDQKLVVDVTAPNHVHLRAGGAIDRSTADIILGGEENHVRVSDESSGSVNIFGSEINISSNLAPSSLNINTYSGAVINSHRTSSYDAEDKVVATLGDIEIAVPSQSLETDDSPSFNQIYVTNNNGTGQNVKIGDDAWIGDVNLANYVGITGAQDATEAGIVLGSALENRIYTDGSGLTLESTTGDMNFYMDGGMYIGHADSGNQIIKRSDLESFATSIFPSPVDWTPVVSGNGFAQSSNPATGTYLKYGTMVVVNIYAPFSNVTNFGTGQYSVTLPFPAKNHADVFAGSIHNTGASTDHYSLKGHLADNSSTMTLWYISGTSKDEPFDHNSPITLNTTDLFHMHFIYEIEE